MALTIDQATEVADLMANMGIHDVETLDDYSGRGMFGRTCVALTMDGTNGLLAMAYAAATLGIPFEDLPTTTDGMGYRLVVY